MQDPVITRRRKYADTCKSMVQSVKAKCSNLCTVQCLLCREEVYKRVQDRISLSMYQAVMVRTCSESGQLAGWEKLLKMCGKIVEGIQGRKEGCIQVRGNSS